jgi:multiple sugar transport system substrate-binding protein
LGEGKFFRRTKVGEAGKMNRYLRATIVLLVLCAIVVGLTPRTATAQTPTKVRIFVGIGAGSQPGDREKQEALAAEYNAANSDIQIEFDVYPNVTARDVLLTQVAGDNPPDLVGPVGIRGLYELEDLWADLTDLIEKDDAALKIDEYDESTLKLFETAGGKNLSLALGVYPSVLLANEDMFEAAEVPLPPKEWGAKYTDRDGKEHTWDWEALGMVAQQVTSDESGTYADEEGFDPASIVNYGFGNLWVQPRNFAAAWGSPNAGVKDGKTADFNQEAYQMAFDWLHKGIFEGHYIPDQAGWGTINAGGTSPFESGKLGMWYSQSWYVNCCLGNAKFKWNVYAGPAVPGTDGKTITAPLHADTFAILEKAKNKDAAWKVLQWLNSAETSAKLCLIYGCIPARKPARDIWEKEIVAKFPGLNTDVIAAAPQYQEPSGANNESSMPNYAQAADTLQAFYNSIQADADVDVKAGLDAVNKQIQDIFDGKVPPPTEEAEEAEPEAEATAEATEAS